MEQQVFLIGTVVGSVYSFSASVKERIRQLSLTSAEKRLGKDNRIRLKEWHVWSFGVTQSWFVQGPLNEVIFNGNVGGLRHGGNGTLGDYHNHYVVNAPETSWYWHIVDLESVHGDIHAVQIILNGNLILDETVRGTERLTFDIIRQVSVLDRLIITVTHTGNVWPDGWTHRCINIHPIIQGYFWPPPDEIWIE